MRRWRASIALVLCVSIGTGVAVARAEEQPLLPAGAQFLTKPESLPEGFLVRDPRHVAEHDGTIVVLGSTDIGARDVGVVSAAVRAPDGTWSTVTIDDLRGYRSPRGLAMSDGYLPAGLAAGPDGFVAIGRAGFIENCGNRCSTQGQDGQVQSLMWHSPDGRTWTRIDPRDILGGKKTAALEAVMATPDGGWIVVGSSASTDFRHPSQIVVLTSRDGLRWRRSATIKGGRSLEATGLYQVGATTVLEGVELVCDRESAHHSLAGAMADGDTLGDRIAPLRLWRSDAGGRDWEPIDPTDSGVIKAPRRASFSRRDCATFASAERERLSGSGALVGTSGVELVAVSDDRMRVAVTTDLEHWTVADLPGAIPGGDPPLDRMAGAAALSADADRLTLLSLERQRDPVTDAVVEYRDSQVLAWTTTDGGATWGREPAARPIMASPISSLAHMPSGRVALADGGSIRFSEGGPLAPWGACQPAPGADCAYATIDIDVAGADLHGINLDGAIGGYRDWSGADLRGASMRNASIAASLAGADLRDADMLSASVFGDITGARFEGADMRGAYVPLDILAGDLPGARLEAASFEVPVVLPIGVRLTGRDLTRASFSGPYDGVGDLRRVDFGDARIDGASFRDVDLTGARLSDAHFQTLSFSDVTCPDGKPMKAGAYGLEACRIKAR